MRILGTNKENYLLIYHPYQKRTSWKPGVRLVKLELGGEEQVSPSGFNKRKSSYVAGAIYLPVNCGFFAGVFN